MKKTFRNGWQSWKALAKRIGAFQARIIFSILYFIILTPVGFFIRNKQSTSKGKSISFWKEYDNMPNTLDEMKQQ